MHNIDVDAPAMATSSMLMRAVPCATATTCGGGGDNIINAGSMYIPAV